MSNYVGYALKAGKTPLGKKVVEKVKDFFKPRGRVSNTISSVKPNVPVTKGEKIKSKLNILKQKTKASKAKLDQTLFDIDQRAKKAKSRMTDKRNEKIVKKFIGEK